MSTIDLSVPFSTKITVEHEDAAIEGGVVRMASRSEGPPLHLHANQDEHWEVLEGALTVVRGRERTILQTGATIEIARGTPHTYHNDGDAPVTFRYRLTPGSRFTSMMRTFAWLAAEGRIRGTRDLRSLLHLAQVFVLFQDHVRGVLPPQALLAVLAALGRFLGLVRPFSAR